MSLVLSQIIHLLLDVMMRLTISFSGNVVIALPFVDWNFSNTDEIARLNIVDWQTLNSGKQP